MEKIFENLTGLRNSALKFTEGLTADQLNKISAGFNNNIIWNLGHVIASVQLLCYFRSNLPMPVDEAFVNRFKSGTKPEGIVGEDEISLIKGMMLSTIEKLQQDYNNGIFKEYNPVITRYGVELTNVDQAIDFLQFHEGFHMGYVLALKRLV